MESPFCMNGPENFLKGSSPEERIFVFDSPVVDAWLQRKMSSRKSSPHISLEDSPFSMFKIQKKRTLGSADSNQSDCFSDISNTTPVLKRRAFTDINSRELSTRSSSTVSVCQSPTIAKLAVQKSIQNPNLMGDFSKDFYLPLIKGKHSDIATISPETVMNILKTETRSYHIIDCRYPYEYDGGHILSARNIYLKEEMWNYLFREPLKSEDSSKVLILYCEFSSERAPRMYRYIRNTDRELNKDTYPSLHYPEMYLIEGGYKGFFQNFKNLCEPQMYRTMLDKDCVDELVQYKAKSHSRKKGRRLSRPIASSLNF